MNESGRPKPSSWVNKPKRPPVRWPPPPPDDPFDSLLPQPQPSRSRRTADWRPWFSANGPVWVRLVWSGRSGEIEGVRVRNANTQTYSSVRPTDRLAADIREAFAHFIAEDIVAAAWPASGTGVGPPTSSAELLNVTEELLDPRLLAAEVIRVIVQIAAVHAGIPPFVARVMGQAAGDLFTELASPDPDASKVQAVQYADFALSVEDGSLINSPALPQIATAETANAIDELLRPDAPENPSPARPARPSDEPARPAWPPGEPARPARPPDEPARPARLSSIREPLVPPGRHQPGPATGSDPVPDPPPQPSPTDIGDLGPGFGV
jgi:hypothetical protein